MNILKNSEKYILMMNYKKIDIYKLLILNYLY